MVCRAYAVFLEHVSAGRNMDIDKVRSLARGRVWSGQDAFQHGLVDDLGGLSDAITTAKELADLPQVSHLHACFYDLDFFPVKFVCAFQHHHMRTSSVR